MKRLMLFAANHPWPSMLFFVLLTVLAAFQLGDLRIHVSADGMMLDGDPAKQFLEQTQEVFGGEEGTLVVVQDPDLMTPEKLAAVDAARQRIEALPFVSRTVSLFTVTRVENRDGVIITEPFLDPIPQTPEAAAAVLAAANAHPLVARTLVSEAGDALVLAVYFSDKERAAGFDGQAAEALEQSLRPLRGQLEQAFQIGTPSIRAAITEQIIEDQRLILPGAMALLLAVLALGMRHWSAALVPMITAGMSIIWTLALLAVTDTPVGVMTSIIPALLVIIGSTEDIHMLAAYREGVRSGLDPRGALMRMVVNLKLPLLLTFVTTYLGFLSIAANPIGLLQEFGVAASTGLFFNFLITLVFVPAWLSLFGGADSGSAARTQGGWIGSAATRLYRVTSRHRTLILAAAAAISLLSLAQAMNLRVDNDFMAYFDRDQPVSQHTALLDEAFSGSQTFSIVIDSKIEGAFRKVRYLEELEKLQQFLGETGRFQATYSFADVIKLTHATLMGEGTPLELPYEDAFIDDYTFLLGPNDVAAYVSSDYSAARVEVRHAITSSEELRDALDLARLYLEQELDRGLRSGITGEAVLNMHASDYMALGQAFSLGIMVAVIWVVISVLFFSLKAGLVALIPNLVPVAVLFGVMGYFGIPLDTSTAMVAAIALGICVDDTMHFMTRYHQESAGAADVNAALEASIREEVSPIVFTSVALAAGFALLGLSDFPPVVHFGLLSALVVLSALGSTFVLTPLLLQRMNLVSIWSVLGLHLQRRITHECPLFAEMRPWQIKQFILCAQMVELEAGENAFLQGDSGEAMYVILDGAAEVWRHSETGGYRQITLLHAGETFGEMALVNRMERNASVTATEPTLLLRLNWQHLRRIGRLLPGAAAKLNLNLAAIIGKRLSSPAAEGIDLETGALGRPLFESFLQHAIRQGQFFNEPLSRITVTLKDPSNAAALGELTKALRGALRPVDIFGRTAVDELTILLPKTDQQGAHAILATLERGRAEGAWGAGISDGFSMKADTVAFP